MRVITPYFFSTLLPATLKSLVATFGLFASCHAQALESETISAFALRGQKQLSPSRSLDLQFTSRWQQDFQQQDRSIVQIGLNQELNNWDLSAGYHQQFDRVTPGKEHRLWQQVRYNFNLGNSSVESSARIEERYFTDSEKTVSRLRVLNRWSQPITTKDTLRLGYEWVYNLNDLNANSLHGVNQNRLIAGVSHKLDSGTRIELEYQLRYLHIPARSNRVQHQIQLSYSFIF